MADDIGLKRKHRGKGSSCYCSGAPIVFGVFVAVADGVEGLVPLRELGLGPLEAPEDAFHVGDEVTVLVTEIDRVRRRLALSRR